MDDEEELPSVDVSPEAQDSLRQQLWEIFNWSPSQINVGRSGKPSTSTNSRKPSLYDKHLADHLILKRIRHVKYLHRKVAFLAESLAEERLRHGGLGPTGIGLKSSKDRKDVVRKLDWFAYNEKSIEFLYENAAATLCIPIASGLLLHPHYWDNPLLAYRPDDILGGTAVSDAFLRFRETMTVKRDIRGEVVWHDIPRWVLPEKRDELARVMDRFPTLVTWEFKSLSVGDHHAMFALQLIVSGWKGIEPFQWMRCKLPASKCEHHETHDQIKEYDSSETLAIVLSDIELRSTPEGKDILRIPLSIVDSGNSSRDEDAGHALTATADEMHSHDGGSGDISDDGGEDTVKGPPRSTAGSMSSSIRHLDMIGDTREDPDDAEDLEEEFFDDPSEAADGKMHTSGEDGKIEYDLDNNWIFKRLPWVDGITASIPDLGPDLGSQSSQTTHKRMWHVSDRIVNRSLERSGTDMRAVVKMQEELKAQWSRISDRACTEPIKEDSDDDDEENLGPGPSTDPPRRSSRLQGKVKGKGEIGIIKDGKGRRQATAYHLLQQSWAQAVNNQLTAYVISSGNYEFLCIRVRETQTLYISDLLHPQSLKSPGYGQILVGFCILAYQDAVRRCKLHDREQEEAAAAAEAEEYRDDHGGDQGDSDDRGSDGDDGKKDDHQTEPKPRPRKRTRTENQSKGESASTGGRQRSSSGSGLGSPEERISGRRNMMLYIKYGIYDSVYPTLFQRLAGMAVDAGGPPIESQPRRTSYAKPDSFSLCLKSEIGEGVTGLLHGGYASFGSEDAAEVKTGPLIIKMAFTESEARAVAREHKMLEYLAIREVEGVPKSLGLFQSDSDEDETAICLILYNAGERRVQSPCSGETQRSAFRRVLDTIHTAGVVHGDLNLECLQVTESAHAVITNFHSAECDSSPSKITAERQLLDTLLGRWRDLDAIA